MKAKSVAAVIRNLRVANGCQEGESMFLNYVKVFLRKTGRACLLAAAGLVTVVIPHPAEAAQQWASCTPDEVMVYTAAPRLHVRCMASVGNIRFFAISNSDQAQAARVLSVINTALVAGRTLSVLYDPDDLSGAAIGCGN